MGLVLALFGRGYLVVNCGFASHGGYVVLPSSRPCTNHGSTDIGSMVPCSRPSKAGFYSGHPFHKPRTKERTKA